MASGQILKDEDPSKFPSGTPSKSLVGIVYRFGKKCLSIFPVSLIFEILQRHRFHPPPPKLL
jgi:hypothetical protein